MKPDMKMLQAAAKRKMAKAAPCDDAEEATEGEPPAHHPPMIAMTIAMPHGAPPAMPKAKPRPITYEMDDKEKTEIKKQNAMLGKK